MNPQRHPAVTIPLCLLAGQLLLSGASVAPAAPPPTFPRVILGDSLSEGVQPADASWRTQRHTYVVHVATALCSTRPLS